MTSLPVLPSCLSGSSRASSGVVIQHDGKVEGDKPCRADDDCRGRHAATTTVRRAEKPGALSAKVAGRPVQIDRIVFVPPVLVAPSVSVGENHPALFRTNTYGGDGPRHVNA